MERHDIFRIENATAESSGECWEVYQWQDGDEYEVSGGVASKDEAEAVVSLFVERGAPRLNTITWCRAFDAVGPMLDALRSVKQ